ncbi:hypothetical protein [Kitasatospora sp. NPDC050543]|uniref:hypothetical protein n=1 Tax=Kitasatospora sp. NPDC050543 TaxID=3364054 RepID=UPI00378A11D0
MDSLQDGAARVEALAGLSRFRRGSSAWPRPPPTRRRPRSRPPTHDRFGQVTARCWGRLHPKLERRGSWANHQGELPIVEGTLVHLTVEYLPGNRDPKPLWLWHSDPDAAAHDVDRLWRIFLRRFDIEHTFRFFKQTLGLTRPRLRTPGQADRWVWLILAAYAQLRLARPLAEDLRRPWEKPLTPDQLTPARVRRGYPASDGPWALQPARQKPPSPAQAAPGDAHPPPHPATRSE